MVGGGIGGLAAAAFLRRAGLPATVYEQAAALGEVGAGLVVAPNAARLLRRLPSAPGLDRAGVALEAGWEFRRWADGTVLFVQRLGDACVRRYGEHTWTMHRAVGPAAELPAALQRYTGPFQPGFRRQPPQEPGRVRRHHQARAQLAERRRLFVDSRR